MFKKFSTFTLCFLIMLTLFTGCSNKRNTSVSNTDSDNKLNVVVTFNAMKEFAKAIGENKIAITTMIPDGTEPHDFEPKAKDMEKLCNADVFIYNGLSMESWADGAIKAANNNSLVSVDASKGCNPIKNTDKGEVKEHGQYDPHVWLSLKGAILEAKNIEQAFIKADPKNKEYYKSNFNNFKNQLNSLYNEYQNKFNKVTNKTIVTGHAAFAYFCRDFGLKQNSVEDVFADGEPSAKELSKLVKYCKENNVKTIFAEELVSTEVSDTLAEQVGAKVKVIHTIESSENDLSYINRMKDNLNLIYESL